MHNNNEQKITNRKRISFFAVILIVIAFCVIAATCLTNPNYHNTISGKVSVPDDFSFSLTWGCYGISHYDSKTEKLVKTTDATNPDDYVAYYKLTEQDTEYIYSLISDLNIDSYPY